MTHDEEHKDLREKQDINHMLDEICLELAREEQLITYRKIQKENLRAAWVFTKVAIYIALIIWILQKIF